MRPRAPSRAAVSVLVLLVAPAFTISCGGGYEGGGGKPPGTRVIRGRLLVPQTAGSTEGSIALHVMSLEIELREIF